MARPIEYDRDQVIHKAMRAFWAKGYAATSISDLVKVTKLNTCTMYKLFGGKDGLFEAVLKSYRNKYLAPGLNQLRDNPGFDNIKVYLTWLGSAETVNGCFFVNTLTEQHSIGEQHASYVKAYFAELEQLLKQNLVHAKKEGQFSGDVIKASQILICTLLGLSDYSKLNPQKNSKKDLLENTLNTMMK